MKFFKALIFIYLCYFNTYAQDWTLQECIDHAIENNLTIKRSLLMVASGDINYQQSKMALLPNLIGSGSTGYNWGRSIDPTTNFFVTERVGSAGLTLSSSMTLLNGLTLRKTMEQNQLGYEASLKDLEKTKNDVIFNIITLYTNVLFSAELTENARKQLDATMQQRTRTEKLVQVGSLPKSNLLDLLAQEATNELNLVNRENELKVTKMQLKQALQLSPDTDFEVVDPQLSLDITPVLDITAIEVYTIALKTMPEIESATLNVKSAELGVKAAKGNLYPSVTLNGSMRTNYSDVFVTEYGFIQQFEDNLSKSVSIGINISIFNRMNTRAGIQRAEISREQAAITTQEVQYQLWSVIEQAYNDVVAAAKSYQASVKQVAAREEAFRMMKQRYEAGAVNNTDFQLSENDLFQAKSDLLRAKYDYIFKMKVLDFYQGKPLTFTSNDE